MKRIKWLAFVLLGIFWCSVSVWAGDEEDVWKPDEPFFAEHEAECTVENREYFANGPNGKVVIYESPASSKVVKTLENEEIVLIDYVFTNDKGITWGLCEFEGTFGWLPMPYMVVVYDYLNFEEEYGELFQEERGSGVGDGDEYLYEFFKTSRKVRFWAYPGSESKYTIQLPWGFAQNIPDYTKTFVDEDGRKWGFVSYYQGENPNRWICINSVEEMVADFSELYPNGAPVRDKRVIEPYEGEEIFPDDYEQVQMMQKVKKVAITVGIVVVVGVVMMCYWKLWKKMKEA